MREQFTTIAIETLKEFAVFAYEISVEVIRKGRKFYIILRGLSAKTNTVPGVQPARCELNFKDLAGEYTVYVVKQDGAINGAYYKIRPQDKALKLVKVTKPRKKIIATFANLMSIGKEIVLKKNFSLRENK